MQVYIQHKETKEEEIMFSEEKFLSYTGLDRKIT